MARPKTDKLIDRARSGERLTSSERRQCVAYLQVVEPESSNVALGELFGVSETQIRLDIKKLREEKAKAIREDDIGLVIADIAITFERQVRDIEESKNKCEKGTRTYLEHCRTLARLQVERVELLQNLGYYPKNLGNMTVSKFHYEAFVREDTTMEVRQVEEPEQSGQIMDADFEDVKLLAAPESENEQA